MLNKKCTLNFGPLPFNPFLWMKFRNSKKKKKREKDYSLIDKAAVAGSQNSRDAFGTECLLCMIS